MTIPAGTAQSSPLVTPVSFPDRVVSGVHWKVPPGPSGLMGWRLTMSNGIAVIPVGGGWIISDDDSDTWVLSNQPTSGQWEVTGYNTDVYDHTVYITFLLDLTGGQTAPVPMTANEALSSPASVSTAPSLLAQIAASGG